MKTNKYLLYTLLFLLLPLGLLSQSPDITGDSIINRCQDGVIDAGPGTYTIEIQNTSGNDLTNIIVVAKLQNLTGFSYVSGSSVLTGPGAFSCTNNPVISGGYPGLCAPAPAPPYLTWNIDASCGGLTLANGETLTVEFQLETDCTAVSGSLNAYIDYQESGTPMCNDTGVLNIQVNPGAVTIKKEQNVIPQVLGGDVTWTLTIENTGFGVIENVEVTDVLDAGLSYVSSTQSGNNSGQTTTWTSNEYAALASMNPGVILTMDITATVISCDDLNNTAEVRFGCNPSPANTCFDTSADGGTARASVQRIVRTPVLGFTPPDVNFTYCDDTESFAFTITNTGDGIAYDVYTIVDFTGFNVTNVSGGAVYNVAQQRFELAAPLAAGGDPGDSYDLSFDLTYTGDFCAGGFPSGDLLWQKLYLDECDQEFYPPVELSSINALASGSSLSVSKNGAGSVIQIGDPVTYTVTSAYSGPLTCGSPSGTTGLITVVDTVPAGFTVTDAGGGAWVPGGGGTGGTITWTYTPPASLNTAVTIQSPDATQCETYCNTLFTNSITADGTDCCGCALSATDSETTAIECAEGVTSNKTSSTPTERCDDTSYTNTYNFSGGSGVVLSDLQFEEHAELQQVYNGNLTVMLGAADVTGCVGVTDNTPGGSVLLDFSGCAATPLAGQTLTITYDLTATANTVAACSGSTFYSWSSLDMGPAGSNCLGDGVIHETVEVTINSPGMSLSIAGLGQIFHTCESKTITMTLTQTSANSNPRDVRLVLSGLNYYVTNPAATICGGGIAPVSCTPAIDGGGDYIWTFSDAFTGAGQTATIQLEVQKRCGGAGALIATAYFDDLCTDDATSDELCSVVASESPALLLSGDLLIEKTPETYYANTSQVQWEIYVTNRGTGNAYNVWVDDVLGSGLLYEHGVNPVVVDDMTGVTINDSLDHDGGAINGASVEIAVMAAGERRQITFIAQQIDCSNLTNDVTANWGCIGVDCQTDITDSSTVTIPAPNLINTNVITPQDGVDACESPSGFITLRNAGQVTCYNLQVTETLPPNLTYIGGSTRWRLNGGGWNGPNAAYDPNPTVSPLVWSSTEIAGLATATPGDTIEIEFDMASDCPFTGGDITCSTQYENPCADVFNTADSTFTAAFNEPDITIEKTRANDPIGCNEAIQWTITVTNDGAAALPIIWIEDTMDATFTYVSSVGDPPFTSDNGTNAGQLVTWELRNVNPGDTVTLTLNATTDSAPCSPDLDNTVIAYWGCGLADGSSATKPGVDAPDDSLCLGAVGETDTRTETRQPDLGYLDITMSPASIDSCDDSTQLTIVLENTGPTDAYTIDLAIDLPPGITYNAGTAESGLGTDQASAVAGIAGIGDPAISGSTITFFDFGDKGTNLTNTIQADGGSDTLVLRFTVQSACYVTADMDFDLRYYDCCDDDQYTNTDSQQLTALFPGLTITKTPTDSQVDCAAQQSWTITVTNNGTGDAQIVRVEDTPGDWIDVRTGQPGDPIDMGGGVYGWEVNNIVSGGGTAVFTLVGTLNPDGLPNQNDCAAALRQNNVQAIWACGTAGDAIDNDPTTTSDYDCEDSTPANAPAATLQMPNLVVTSITPSVSCTSDGNFSGSVTVRVTNNGDGDTGGTTFTVEVTDGLGWTGTGTHSANIAAGGFADVTIDTATWNPDCQPCGAPYSFNATVDLNNDICECNETDNDTGSATTYQPPIPDLTITDIDFSNVSCTNDNISGNVRVQVENLGCAAANNFQVTLTTDGCLTFTAQNNLNLNASTSTWLTFNISGSWADCTLEDCDFTAVVDAPTAVCECDGTNNSRTETYSTVLPDLIVTDINYDNVSCAADAVSGFVRVTVQNQGYGSAANFDVSLATDGCLTFAVNQTVAGPLTNGQTATVDFPIASTWANPADCACDFTATVDVDDDVCECDGTNNTLTTTYNHPLPNLRITSITPTFNCAADGSLTGNVAVAVDNNGCGDAVNVLVRLTSTGSYTFTDQNITLTQGQSTTLNFSFTPTAANCDVDFTAVIDPTGLECESTGSDNTDTYSNYTPSIPDLEATADTLQATCNADGSILISGNLTVDNGGCGTFTTNIPVRYTLYDNTGCAGGGGNTVSTWTSTLTAVNINGGADQDFAVSRTITTDLIANSTGCQFSIGVELDYTTTICEFDGTNNTYCADNKNVDIPDLRGSADTLGVTCSTDGNVQISGNVTITNDGCGSNMVTDIPVRFTLFSGNDCTGTNLGQWTETLTAANIAAGGGAQAFTITPQTLAADLAVNSTGCEVSVRMEVDYTSTICESDMTDNTYCAGNIPVDIPDLEYDSDTLSITASGDGQAQVGGTVTVANNGCGSNMTTDIPVRITVYDDLNCTGNMLHQWTETLASANIAAGGGTQTFTVTNQSLAGNYCTGSTGCQISMRIELDHSAAICETDGTDNSACVNKTVDIPDLVIDAVASSITCLSDGSLTGTTVTVRNGGCGDATNVVVRLASDCGLTFTDEIVNLAAGATEDVFFAFASGITGCTCNFTAVVDPDDTIFECDGTNNTGTSVTAMLIPDMTPVSDTLTVSCADDGVIRVEGTVTLGNEGCGPNATDNVPMRFTLFSGNNCSGAQLNQWTETFTGVSIPSGGGTQTFTIRAEDVNADVCTGSAACQFSIRIEADYNDSICEWDGTNNILCSNKSSECYDLETVSLVPATNCAGDGSAGGTLALTLRNNGGTAITRDFSIRVDDGQGWTSEQRYNADLGGVLPLAAGAVTTVTFTWDRDFMAEPFTCEFNSIMALLDSQDEICQCQTENDLIAAAYQLPLPNLKPTLITPACSGDAMYTVQVTVENNGCGGTATGDFTVRLTDDMGNTMDVQVNGLASGETTTVDFNDWPAACSPGTVIFTATVDVNDDVCEIKGAGSGGGNDDNTMDFTYTNTSPDLSLGGVSPMVTCPSPGNMKGSLSTTITNIGNGPAVNDFQIIVDDGEGWTAEKWYNADLNGGLPIGVGQTVTVKMDWSRNFTGTPQKCNFNNIMVSLDGPTDVCECAAGNNETVTTYQLPYPDLYTLSLRPVCIGDGEMQLQVGVGNQGCEDQKEDFNITFSDTAGQTQTVSFTAAGGVLPLKADGAQTVNLQQWAIGCTMDAMDYTVVLDGEGAVCDMDTANNTMTYSHTFTEPDLQVGDLDFTCNGDGTITFRANFLNTGRGNAPSVRVTAYDDNGNGILDQEINLAAGGSETITFTTGVYPWDDYLTFRFVVDEAQQSCECDGLNNEKSISIKCDSTKGGEGEEGEEEPLLKLSSSCPPGRPPGGVFPFEIHIENTGALSFTSVTLEDILPDGFTYIPGTAVLDATPLPDPVGTAPMVWQLGELDPGAHMTLFFNAAAGADVKPGQYCNQAHVTAWAGNDSLTNDTRCCTVVTPQTGAGQMGTGCCLDVEQWPGAGFHKPDAPLSFIEPYFHTESSMFAVYSIFNLWDDAPLETGGMPRFMRERLLNYARSTMETFYLESGMGITQPDGSLRLSFGGGYPDVDPDLQDKTDEKKKWLHKQVDETMTVSQLAFELMALNETANTEEEHEDKARWRGLIEKRLTFLAEELMNPENLTHGFELSTGKGGAARAEVRRLNAKATLYDKASLYLAMVELGNSDFREAAGFAAKLRALLKPIDDTGFDKNNHREELLFTLALLESGDKAQAEQAAAKMKAFETIFKDDSATDEHGQTRTNTFNGLHDYALAAAVAQKTGSSLFSEITAKMKKKFYLKDTGIFADKQPDFTFKLNLMDLAPLMMVFDGSEAAQRDHNAMVLYRTFDEVGLFLKKRNLSVGKPLYSLLKNYPFADPLLPVLSFTKGHRFTAPVLSQNAVVHSTQFQPLGERQIPQAFSKILSPGYETDSANVAAVSFALQHMGRMLKKDSERVTREEGRSFDETGKKYLDALLHSGSGLLESGYVLLPFDTLAMKGPKGAEHNLEPLTASPTFSTGALADYMLAETLYLQGNGKHADTVRMLKKIQTRVLQEFKKTGYIPKTFGLFKAADGSLTLKPSPEKASKVTAAKLFHLLPKDKAHKFFRKAVNKSEGAPTPEDLLFLAAAPDLAPYFEKELKDIVALKDSKVSHNAADIIGRRLLDGAGTKGDWTAGIGKALDNLQKHWDKEAMLPKSDTIETIEKGIIYHHDPRQFLLYLSAAYENRGFNFHRTLHFFTYLLENEWGVEWEKAFLTLPSAEYRVFREGVKENIEPGDRVNMRVRVDNTCPDGFGSAYDLSALYLKAAFTPPLVHTGTEFVDGLDTVGEFQWRYNGFPEGAALEYFYQAFVPGDFAGDFIDGSIYVGGRQGLSDFGMDTAAGDQCEDLHHVKRMKITPFEELQGLVYEDRNADGIKDAAGEPGIPNILIKDTRGRLFRSDAEGRFTVLAGDEHEGVQLELKYLPPRYLLPGHPTRLVNRRYTGVISFGLVPTVTVTGFVYVDENGNGSYDDGEKKPAGVWLKAKDKEVLTSTDGVFIFRNLPELWKEYIKVNDIQPYAGTGNYKIHIDQK